MWKTAPAYSTFLTMNVTSERLFGCEVIESNLNFGFTCCAKMQPNNVISVIVEHYIHEPHT